MRTYKRESAACRQAAYHDGPPEIAFAGRAWQRGQPQAVTEQEWLAMQARPDFAGFAFAETGLVAEAGEAIPAPQVEFNEESKS